MAEDLKLTSGLNKKAKYIELIPQIEGLVAGEHDLIANLANICAALKQTFDFLWVGFYLTQGTELVLGPFQGPVACTRIKKGAGVCGMAWQKKQTLVVPDVNAFAGHIACSSLSKSEIVVPGFKNDKVALVLDIDSDQADDFSDIDHKYLNEILKLLTL